jgi:hypothetical protein
MTDREISLSKCKNIEFDFEQVTWNLDLLVHSNRVCNVLKCPGRCPTCLSVSEGELDSRYVPKSPGRTGWTSGSLVREVSRVSSGCPRGVCGRDAQDGSSRAASRRRAVSPSSVRVVSDLSTRVRRRTRQSVRCEESGTG